MKRGQTQEIFVWLFVLIVAGAILFFGIKLIKKSEGLKDEVLVVKFFNDLDKKLSQYYFLRNQNIIILKLNLKILKAIYIKFRLDK